MKLSSYPCVSSSNISLPLLFYHGIMKTLNQNSKWGKKDLNLCYLTIKLISLTIVLESTNILLIIKVTIKQIKKKIIISPFSYHNQLVFLIENRHLKYQPIILILNVTVFFTMTIL